MTFTSENLTSNKNLFRFVFLRESNLYFLTENMYFCVLDADTKDAHVHYMLVKSFLEGLTKNQFKGTQGMLQINFVIKVVSVWKLCKFCK